MGNAENAAAVEMTLTGATIEFETAAVVALTGAEFDGDLPGWTAVAVHAGAALRCGTARRGARGYLCVRGGIAVPLVLGSASTHLITALGGHEGRALRKDDVLPIGEDFIRQPRTAPAHPPHESGPGVLHALPGPQAELFGDGFFGSTFEVMPESNRMGLRLRGAALATPAGQMITQGVVLGSVQVPPGGQPLVLFVEHQTTGGYPAIANVISAGFSCLGQLRPRDAVQFKRSTMAEAWRRLQRQEAWLYSLL